MPKIHIRKFELKDRADVRRISCETSFLEEDRSLFLDDDEILADALTIYYTDHEPESCFVAAAEDKVIGYIIGTKDVPRMEKIFSKHVVPELIRKAFKKGFFFKIRTWQLFLHVAISALKGEFHAPHFSAQYPGMLHINIDKGWRGHQIGKRLIDQYLDFLKAQGIRGVHFGTMSEDAKGFFLKSGFTLLHASKRSYLKFRIGKEVPFYIFGKDRKGIFADDTRLDGLNGCG
jgi:GNAT superfamily N-acetyltransferase